MGYVIFHVFLVSFIITNSYCQQNEEEEPAPPHHPYAFSYAAGRAPGHTDRIHSETSDGTGVIRGKFSYIDPRQKVHTVEYVADKDGFHPLVIAPPIQDTVAVAKAKERHANLYNRIAAQQAAEQQRVLLERGPNYDDDGSYKEGSYQPNPNIVVEYPRDTVAVHNAKVKHFNLFQRIAEEHAKIAAERKINEEDREEALRYNPVY